MKNIGRNEALINQLSGELSLISSKLQRIDIFLNGENLHIDIYLSMTYSKEVNTLKLSFTDIEEYSFFYKADRIFYNVEIYKFFVSKDGIYISFDPEDESEVISNQDQDYILCKNVEGLLISKGEQISVFSQYALPCLVGVSYLASERSKFLGIPTFMESSNYFQSLIGEQLSSVEFVQNYLQLHFDGNTVTFYSWPILILNNKQYDIDNVDYRNKLCSVIGKIVTNVLLDDKVVLKF